MIKKVTGRAAIFGQWFVQLECGHSALETKKVQARADKSKLWCDKCGERPWSTAVLKSKLKMGGGV